MTITRNELQTRVKEAVTVFGSVMHGSGNPRPFFLNAMHRLFPDGYVEQVTGLNDSERGSFESLRDGPMHYFIDGANKGQVDWERTMEHLKASNLHQLQGWALALSDLDGWLHV